MNRVTSQASLTSMGAYGDVLRYSISQCYLGHVLVARSSKGVCAVLIGDTQKELEKELEKDLAGRFRDSIIRCDKKDVQDDLTNVVRSHG